MKYIYYLAIVVIIISLSIFGLLYNSDSPKQNKDTGDIAFRVNGRTFSNEEFNVLKEDKPHDLKINQYINTIIDKELLIQEAMKQKIHDESGFKKNIKNFYEQSLISALMSRKAAEFKASVTDDEISKFLKIMNSEIELTTYSYKDFESAEADTANVNEKTTNMDFSELSDNLKYIISEMKPGQRTYPLPDEYGYKVILLKNIKDSGLAITDSKVIRSMAEKIITEGKKKAFMEKWQQDLKKMSDIEIKAIN